MKSFKTIKSIVCLTALLFIVGCGSAQNGVESQSDKWEMSKPKIYLHNNDINDWLDIEDLNFYTKDDGLIKIEAIFRNSSSFSKELSYKINWKNENGMSLDTMLSKWQTIELDGKESFVIKGLSPSVKVTDFKIEFKEN